MAHTRSSVTASLIAGEEIRRARHARGLTQVELADRLSVAPSFVARLESGKANPTVGQLEAIARALRAGFEIHFAVLPEQWAAR